MRWFVPVAFAAMPLLLAGNVWREVGPRWPELGAAWRGLPDHTGPGVARALAGHLLGLGWVAAWLSCAWAAGRPAGWLGGIAAARPERVVLRLLSGWAVLGLAQIGLGFAGLLAPALLRAQTAGLVLAGGNALLRVRPWRAVAPGPGDRWPAAVALLGLAVMHLAARLPDVLEDAMVYHLAWPEEIVRTGRITVVAGHVQWRFPKGIEALAVAPWAAGGITAAKSVTTALAVSLIPAVLALTRALGGGSGWWAVAWLLVAGLPLGLVRQAKNDLGGAVFATGAAWALLRAGARGGGWWLVAGWFAGAAINARVTAALALGPLALLAAVPFRSRRSFAPAAAGLAAAALPFGAWAAAQWYAAGNPVVPFGTGWFPDLAWTAVQRADLAHYIAVVSGSGPLGPAELLVGFWRALSLSGVPVLLVLLPVAALAARGPAARRLLLAGLAAYALWLPTERNGRFLFPVAIWVAAVGAASATGATRTGRWLAAGRIGLLAAALAGLPVSALYTWEVVGLRHLLGQVDAPEYLARRWTTYEQVRRWTRDRLPGDAVLCFTGEIRRLEFHRPVRSIGPADAPPLWRLSRDAADPDRLRVRIRQTGATHLLHNFIQAQFRGLGWYPGPAWSDRQLRVTRDFFARWTAVAFTPDRVDHLAGGYYVFALRRRAAAVPGPVLFVPGSEGVAERAFRLLQGQLYPQAFAELRRALRAIDDVFEVQNTLGYYASFAGRFDEARRWLEPGIRAGFVSDRNWTVYAFACHRTGRRDEARRAARRAYALDPTPAHARLLELVGKGALSSIRDSPP